MSLGLSALAGHTVIYGGSFNPPHLGHQMGCLYLLEGLGAEVVWLMPVFAHPFGKAVESFGHRAAMCRLLASPFGERVVVSEIERELGGQSRTYDTLVHLCAAHPARRFALAIGADNLDELPRWHRFAELEALLPIVVVGRSGYANAGLAAIDLPAVASRELRARVARGESLLGLVPETVADYVAKNRLFRDGA